MTMSKPILLISIGFLICLVRAWGQKGPLAPAGRILKKRQTNENQEFLNAHNERRRNVNPSASNMKEMIWSDELYTIARNYAQQCSFSHNSQRSSQSQTFSYVGENIYMGTFGTATDAVRSWDEEKSYYDLSSNTCTRTCGHYTQVVWTDSEYLGCARQQCGNSYLIVCNYGPGGNFNNQRPYTSGATCSQCPSGYTCNNQLCSKSSTSNPCNPNPCQNGGTCSQNSGNAQCSCASGWTGSFCETQVTSNPCSPNPCQNGGTCSQTSGNAQCSCASGWTGSFCETQVNSNPCAPNPCLNGGTCSSNSGSAVCTCTSGWTGSLCQTPDTGNGIFQCGFETGMCLQNHQFNTINFYRTQAFPGISSAPEGNYYTLATSNFQSKKPCKKKKTPRYMFYFTGLVGGSSGSGAVAVDNIRVTEI